MNLTIQNNDILISSREIAEITNKRHDNIIRDIESQLKNDALKFEGNYLDNLNRNKKQYLLPKNIALGIVSGYSFELRMKIINRLEELEKQNKTFLSLRWTSIGKNWLKNNFEKALHRCDEKTFNEYNMQILSNLPTIPNTRNKRF